MAAVCSDCASGGRLTHLLRRTITIRLKLWLSPIAPFAGAKNHPKLPLTRLRTGRTDLMVESIWRKRFAETRLRPTSGNSQSIFEPDHEEIYRTAFGSTARRH